MAASFAVTLFGPLAPSGAQMISPMLYNGPVISLQAHANNQHSTAEAGDGRSAEPAPPAPAPLVYRPDPARRRANLARFVARLRAIDPAGADRVASLFAEGDIIDRIRPVLARQGLDIDNVGDAYAAYWITAFQAMRGDTGTPARAMVDAVKGQAARAVAPRIGAGDAARQEIAESLWLQTMLLDGANEGAQGKPDQLSAVRMAAVRGAGQVGLDLNRMTLSEQGFVPVP